MRLILILIFCFLIVGCVYESNLPDEPYIELSYEEDLRQSILHIDSSRIKLSNIELSDGISLDEANTILDNFYLSDKADGCGGPGNIVDKGKQWKAATFVGFAPKRSYPIFIDKKTGAIERNNEILVTDPKTLIFDDPVYYVEAKMQIKQIEKNLQKHPKQKLKVEENIKWPAEIIEKVNNDHELRESVMEEYPELFQVISALMFKHDPIGINFDTNTDEYDPEAGTVIPRLKHANSADDVTTIVHEEFVRWFGKNSAGNRNNYINLGQEIWNLWIKYL